MDSVFLKSEHSNYDADFDSFLLHWSNLDNKSKLSTSAVKPACDTPDHSDVTQYVHEIDYKSQ